MIFAFISGLHLGLAVPSFASKYYWAAALNALGFVLNAIVAFT